MITLKTEDVNSVCSKILYAVDNNGSDVTEILELVLKNNTLYMQVTNREYFVRIKLATGDNEDFNATVNAELFLKLVQKMTTELINLEIEGNSLVISGNGRYKLPLIYDGDKLLNLKEIDINNVITTFNIDGSILNSISVYNSKQIDNDVKNQLMTYYYIDSDGAITFTSGACVNDFKLEEDIKLLLNHKLVRLFKLFKDSKVEFTFGEDDLTQTLKQKKVKLVSEDGDIELTSILPSSDSDLNKFPAKVIRDRVNDDYDYFITINRVEFLQAINRLLIFSERNSAFDSHIGQFEFKPDRVIIYDSKKISNEEIFYSNSTAIANDYNAKIDLIDLKDILVVSNKDYIDFKFGNGQAFVSSNDNIHNVIPESD